MHEVSQTMSVLKRFDISQGDLWPPDAASADEIRSSTTTSMAGNGLSVQIEEGESCANYRQK